MRNTGHHPYSLSHDTPNDVLAASLTIPSALNLLVNLFPDPSEQARSIGVFGGSGAVGNGEFLRVSAPMLLSSVDVGLNHCRP